MYFLSLTLFRLVSLQHNSLTSFVHPHCCRGYEWRDSPYGRRNSSVIDPEKIKALLSILNDSAVIIHDIPGVVKDFFAALPCFPNLLSADCEQPWRRFHQHNDQNKSYAKFHQHVGPIVQQRIQIRALSLGRIGGKQPDAAEVVT